MNSPQILIVLDEEQEDLFRATREVRYLGAGHFRGCGGHRKVVRPSPSTPSSFDFRFTRQTFPTEHSHARLSLSSAYSWHGGRNSALGLGEGKESGVQLSQRGERDLTRPGSSSEAELKSEAQTFVEGDVKMFFEASISHESRRK